jgi:hypothetical protein
MDAQRAPLRVKAPLLARQRIDDGRKSLLGASGCRSRSGSGQRHQGSPPKSAPRASNSA